MRTDYGILAITLVLSTATLTWAQPPATGPKFLYGHDLKVRPVGKSQFDDTTPKVGVEYYHDASANAILAITESGSLAAVPFAPLGNDKKIVWAFAHEFRARSGDEESFANAKKFAVEGFRDLACNRILYVTDQKTITLAPMPAKLAAGQEPSWHHALLLKVRDVTSTSFDKARKFGVEAFKDHNTGGLLYISDTGSIAAAAAPAAPPLPNAVKPPRALHGLNLKVRAANELNFEKARTFAVEVFEDRNTGWLLYVSQTGAIAAAPPPADGVKSQQKPLWLHAFAVSARKAGEDFNKASRYGVEVFQDTHTGHVLYISETGSLAVVAKK